MLSAQDTVGSSGRDGGVDDDDDAAKGFWSRAGSVCSCVRDAPGGSNSSNSNG